MRRRGRPPAKRMTDVDEEQRPDRTPKRPSPLERLSAWDRSVGVEPSERAASASGGRRSEYASRSERRMSRRAKHRRKTMVRTAIVVGPTLVVIAAIVALFALLGGREVEGEAVTTLPAAEVDDERARTALLVIEQGDAVPVLVFFYPRDAGGTVLAMPGATLLKTAEGFETLAELHLSGRDEALQTALSEALGVLSECVASVEWPALRTVVQNAGVADLPPAVLAAGGGEPAQVARALLALAGGDAPETDENLWAGLALEGDADEFREVMGDLVAAVPGGGWMAAELSGRLVEGVGFKYVEPDVEAAKAALAGRSAEVNVTLQVQNGSGVVGIAQEAGEVLAPLGYIMLPAGNSADFPDVERTRIQVAPDVADLGGRVRALLGVGAIEVDETLKPGYIIVVIGKDYIPPATTATKPAG